MTHRSLLRTATVLAGLAVAPLVAQTPAKPAASTSSPPVVPTVIQSEKFEMQSTDKETVFLYERNVVVTGTNLRITCDKLDGVAVRIGGDESEAAIPNVEKLKSLVATGNVRIIQGDREATSDRAEVLPRDGIVVLSGNVVFSDHTIRLYAKGPEMVLSKGERKITGRDIVMTLPPLPDLGAEAKGNASPLSAPRSAK